ncbi:3D domain-containing protein [Virgibacillus necropolis]|uniref:PcsB-like coiled-coil domain-containing protein n=1 Tax=Virgibacillus necropolis TaxID=163877 RepID=UPI003850EF56
MTRRLTAITLATTIVLSLSFGINSYAETKEDLENIQEQRKNVKEDLSEADEQVTNFMYEIEELNKEIERVNLSLKEKQDMIEKTKQNITSTIEEIRIIQDEVKELETDIEKRQELLKNRIASYQKAGGSVSYLEVIFGSQSFGDFISRVTMVNKITESDASLLENLESDIHKVAEKQKLALEKLDELNTMKVEQEKSLAKINEEKIQNEKRRKLLEKKQQEFIVLIDKLQSEDKELASLEADVKQNIAEAAARKASQAEQLKENKSKTVAKEENENKAKAVKEKEVAEKVDETEKKPQDNTDKETFTVTATAYTIESAGGSGVTYTGIDLRENPNAKVIAVDPSFIPLGSVVHVEGYGYAIAGDIGSAINGNKIDVYVPTQQAAIEWGVRTVEVTIQ